MRCCDWITVRKEFCLRIYAEVGSKLLQFETKPFFYKRFIGDGFGIWTQDFDSLLKFADFANNIHSDIKLELRWSREEVVFLNTVVKVSAGKLYTDLHIKPTDKQFSHMRLRNPSGSLVLDRSIRDGDLARGIHALRCKSKQSNAALIVGIFPLRRWPLRHNTNTLFPATSKLRLVAIAVPLHRWMSSYKHTT